MEKNILLWIHDHSHPILDAAFRVSHELATHQFCLTLVGIMLVVHLAARSWRVTLLWLGLGISTLIIDQALKPIAARERPALWAGAVHESSYSLPSSHAVASATFYPLLAWSIGRRFRGARKPLYAAAALLPLFVGVGRLYLGVHWPTDVLIGWTLGIAQTLIAIRLFGTKPAQHETTPHRCWRGRDGGERSMSSSTPDR